MISLIYIYFCVLSHQVVHQAYEIRVIDEFILLGNAAIMKCLLPSFVSDFVQVMSWVVIDDDNTEINPSATNYGNCNQERQNHHSKSQICIPSL